MAASSQHRGRGRVGGRHALPRVCARQQGNARDGMWFRRDRGRNGSVEVGGSDLAAFRNFGQAAKPTGQFEIEFTTGGLGIAG
jgi:hypothetical protein